jgi:hypothetical protein
MALASFDTLQAGEILISELYRRNRGHESAAWLDFALNSFPDYFRIQHQ